MTSLEEKHPHPRTRLLSVISNPHFAIVGLTFALFVYKIKIMSPASIFPMALTVATVQHDCLIAGLTLVLAVAAMALVATAPGKSRLTCLRRSLARVSIAIALLLFELYLIDVVTYRFFATRLYLQDVVAFVSEFSKGISPLRAGHDVVIALGWKKLTLLVLLGAWLAWANVKLVRYPDTLWKNRLAIAGLAALGCFTIYLVPLPKHVYSFGDKPLYENYLERNRTYFTNVDFSPAFRDRLASAPPEPRCGAGAGRRLNVVLVIVESLSAYQSQLFSGVEDWTPQLDRIASTECALTNFHANGWTTIGGLVALLGSEIPLVPEKAEFNSWGSPRLTDYWDLPMALPASLSNIGYHTVFLGGGNIDFLSQRQWLQRIGFQEIYGGDHIRFEKEKIRGPFNSVTDQVLFQSVLDEITRQPSDRPFLLVVETFWSHRPFLAPDGSQLHDEEHVIRFTDKQLGLFYDKLVNQGFLDKGILIVTGDHRAMEPFHKKEFDRFGRSAAARIPAIVATRAVQLPARIDQDYQQIDVASSIRALVSDKYCMSLESGAFLGPAPAPSKCIVQAQGDDRDLVYVKCGKREGTVRVAGDRTRFIHGEIDAHESKNIVQSINHTRARKPQGGPRL